MGAFWKILANTCLPTFVKKLGYFFQHLVTIISKTKKLRLNSTILIFMNYAELRPWSVWPDSAILRVLAVKVFDILTTCNLSLLILSFFMGQPGLFFVYFWSFQANIITISTTNQCEKMSCPSSIWCQDSNSWPLKHEFSPITTRPGLPTLSYYLCTWV